MADDRSPPRPLPRCPICRRPAQEAARPFCSARCAQVDLGRWMTESYAIPAAPADDEEER
ncbi:DNA gyrase inhibitor YacG [Neoroseomonas alba]|uniref:DNA gyrase inhibitor YacG n=1 Tax=Roseomonas alba TaxID=2846776 RepID=UPI0034E30337